MNLAPKAHAKQEKTKQKRSKTLIGHRNLQLTLLFLFVNHIIINSLLPKSYRSERALDKYTCNLYSKPVMIDDQPRRLLIMKFDQITSLFL